MLTLTKKYLALHSTRTNPRLFNQASDCGYYLKDNKRIHAALEILNNQNEMIKLEKLNIVKRGRITDDRNNLLTVNIVNIVADTPTNFICNHMRHIDIPKTVRCRLLKKVMGKEDNQ